MSDNRGSALEPNGHGANPPYNTKEYDAATMDGLQRLNTVSTINLTPEMFEKLYLSPQNKVRGELRKTFGNPTPLAIIGFLISLSPLSADLMGWRGTSAVPGAVGAAGTGTYYFFGGLLMIVGAVGEFLLGNTFPFVVFGSFGAFWLGFAATLQPFYNAVGAYGDDPAAFYSSFAFFQLAMGLLCFVYLICSFRTNIAFVIIFFTLVMAFCMLSGAYWQLANGNLTTAAHLQVAAGAFTFVTCASGWWIFLALMLASVDFPLQIPLGDLSTKIKGNSQTAKERNADEHV